MENKHKHFVKLAHKVMGMKESKNQDKLVGLFNKLMDVKYNARV